MRLPFVFCFFLSAVSLHAQYTFNSSYDFHEQTEHGISLIEMEDGYIVVGNGGCTDSLFSTGLMFLKTDFEGNVIWKKTHCLQGYCFYPLDGNGNKRSIIGDVFVTGSWHKTDSTYDMFLTRFNPYTGDTTLFKSFTMPGNQFADESKEFSNGDIILSYYDDSDPYGSFDMIRFMKMDSLGNIIWKNHYGASYERSGGLFEIGASERIYFPTWYTEPEPEKAIIRTIDSSGNIIDEFTCYDGAVGNTKLSLTGDFISAVHINNDYYQYYLSKMDPEGNFIWEHQTGYDEEPIGLYDGQISFTGFILLPDGSTVCTGYYEAYPDYAYHFYIYKLSDDGTLLWQRFYTGEHEVIEDILASTVLHTSDNGFLIAGSDFGEPLTATGFPQQNMWLLKLDSAGCLVPGCDSLDIAIHQIQNTSDALVYSYEKNIYIKTNEINTAVRIFDATGKLIHAEKMQTSSAHINMQMFSAGVYLVELLNAEKLYRKKVFIE